MKNNSESGFSYIDVMIALVILLVGVLGLLSGITASIVQTRSQGQQLLAKQITTTTMESIMAVKETDPNRMGWGAVGNVGTNPHPITGVNQGIFVNGFQNVLTDAGPDEVVGTADDTGAAVQGVQRRIVISDLCDPDRPSPAPLCNPGPAGPFPVRFRSVQITVTYQSGSVMRQEILNTVLTDYTVQN